MSTFLSRFQVLLSSLLLECLRHATWDWLDCPACICIEVLLYLPPSYSPNSTSSIYMHAGQSDQSDMACLRHARSRDDTITLQQGQSIFRVNDKLLAIKSHKCDVPMLSTMHRPQQVKINDDDAGAWKPLCIVDYVKNIGGMNE